MFMPMRLYQIGDYVLNLFDQEWHGYKTSHKAGPTQFVESLNYAWMETQYRPKPRKVKISGAVVHRTGRVVDAQINRLLELSGMYTDVIAYAFSACCGLYDNGCSCMNRWASPNLIWFHTRGMITDVDVGKSSGSNVPLTITVAIDSAWRPLNRFIWEWRRSRYSPSYAHPTPATLVDALRPYPRHSEINQLHYMQWVKRVYSDTLIMYDPDVWAIVHTRHLPNFNVQTGYGHDWSTSYPNLFAPSDNLDVWSSIPSSIYAFTNLPTTGLVRIVVRNSFDVWEQTEEVSTLSLGELDGIIDDKGFTGLDPGDIVYAGDGFLRPGFVVRSGVILEGVSVPFTYPGLFPGQLKQKHSSVAITPEDTTIQFAQFHTYRRM